MHYDTNPFPKTDTDRYEIWEKVVRTDIDAFLANDWEMCKDDFLDDYFMGIHAEYNDNPDNWKLTYPTLDSYKKEWLKQAKKFHSCGYKEDKREALFNATSLENIEINGNSALLHKKFNGSITTIDEVTTPIVWQTLYKMKKIDGTWLITGFIGYMPNPMGAVRP